MEDSNGEDILKPSDTEPEGSLVSIRGLGLDNRVAGVVYDLGGSYVFTDDFEHPNAGFSAIHGHPIFAQQRFGTADRLAIVRQSGRLAFEAGFGVPAVFNLVRSERLTVEAPITRAELSERAWNWVWARAADGADAVAVTQERKLASNCDDYRSAWVQGIQAVAIVTGGGGAALAEGWMGVAVATGSLGAAKVTGMGGAAVTSSDGGTAIATGECGSATATGENSLSTTSGRFGVASITGPKSAASATAPHGAAIATSGFSNASASGSGGAALALGEYSKASVSGDGCVALALGLHGQARGRDGCALVLVRRDEDHRITHVWSGIVGQGGIQPGILYTLDESGQPAEVIS